MCGGWVGGGVLVPNGSVPTPPPPCPGTSNGLSCDQWVALDRVVKPKSAVGPGVGSCAQPWAALYREKTNCGTLRRRLSALSFVTVDK